MGHMTETHGVSREWVKRAFTELATKLKSYQADITQWMAAATKQMVDNADRCTALETKTTDLETKTTDLETKVSEMEAKMADLYTVISETDAVSIVDNNWLSTATASIKTTSEEA